ncbi:hypothetical protein CERSUDRAFT_116103 [Gelatoporia subvermispora B]|uniref:PH domain-containing protein n=1 Tax=Ceriporiopsis subvermispora (strain B) TaxID=914234 RepID=M2PGZ2_CERS8|nr:hypothetical protein CERSUDRAFT_116103 [Gelatoporia subvermispora B]
MSTLSDGGDGGHAADASNMHDHTHSFTGDLRLHLQNLLDKKELELQQAGTLGAQILQQQTTLQERIRELQELDLSDDDADEADSSVRERYRELTEAIKAWELENEQVTAVFAKHPVNGTQMSPAAESTDAESSRGRPPAAGGHERPKASGAGPSTAQSSRRAKNAAHRADDVEFAFEIGSGLLVEVRRLQALLAEKSKKLQDVEEEKQDLEATIEGLQAALRQQEQSADKFKEENWNLEVTLQELRTQLTESQGSVQRLEGEQKRLTKALTKSRESADQYKNEAEKQQNAYTELKAKHETDVAQARKHTASLQRDKSDLQQTLDSLKTEMARQSKRLPRFGPLTPNGPPTSDALTPANLDEDDVFSTAGASTNNRKKLDNSAMFAGEFGEFGETPDPSPSKPFLGPSHPSSEIEALQQRLAHAQRQISTLKGTLQREKELRIEYRRMLESSPGLAIVEEPDEFVDEEAPASEESRPEPKPKPRLTPYRSSRGRGRGRGRGGLTLMQRLGMAAQSPSSDNEEDDDDDEAPLVPPLPAAFPEHDVRADAEETDPQASPTPATRSNRTSVDGMDPVFANVLKRQSSTSSNHYHGSPLRHSVMARAARGGAVPRRSRGGAAFAQARPPSLIGQPEALAAELGLATSPDGSLVEQDTIRPVETAEFGCQTDFEEPAPPPSAPVPAAPITVDMGVQVVPEPAPGVATTEISMQTDQEPLPIRAETGIQHDMPVPPAPVMVSAGIQHDVPALLAPVMTSTGIQHDAPVPPAPLLVSVGASTDPEPEPERPQPQPQRTYAQAETQTRRVEVVEVDAQTIPEPSPVVPAMVHTDIQTDTIPSPVMAEMEIQTTAPSVASEIQAWQEKQSQWPQVDRLDQVSDISASESGGDSSGDTTIHARPSHVALSDIEEEEDVPTETGSVAETETETEIFTDARQSLSLATPSDSVTDFHSIRTVTDNDRSDSEDDESIRASRLPSRQTASAGSSTSYLPHSTPSPSPSIPRAPTYESKAISADLLPVSEPQTIVEPAVVQTQHITPVPAPPKPELKEMSIQTDDWTPPPVVAPSTPAPAPSPALYRVGPNSQQFQFISPPSSAGPTTTSLPIVAAPSPVSSRDSNVTYTAPRPRTSHSDRRQSIESTLSSAMDDLARSRTPSLITPSMIDKSRPPMMMLPPPPRAPPPPSSIALPPAGSMAPPPFIPDKRVSRDIPPPRPSSPPPAELIQRATTPTLGTALSVPGPKPFGLRHQSSNIPPSQQVLRELPSTSSFRSHGASRAPNSSTASFQMRERERREMSSTSLHSAGQSSQRSSISSDHQLFEQHAQRMTNAATPVTPGHPADISGRSAGSTDPTVIHAITQTMIGEFLYKYTRNRLGKGHGSSRHKRFFWVHPYTRTLYWSSSDPGSSNVSESSAKSAYIEGVRSVLDPNPMPPGIYQYSVVVATPQRDMKFTAPTKERHDIWLNALNYLLTRPSAGQMSSPGNMGAAPLSPMSLNKDLPSDEPPIPQPDFSSPQSQRSARSARTGISVDSWNTTPRGHGHRSQSQISLGGSMGKRSGTPAAEYLRLAGHERAPSPSKDFEHVPGQDDEDLSFELHGDTMSDDGYEGLENVRACCDGRHTVGRSHDHHHHHHHHHDPAPAPPPRAPSRARDHLDAHPQETARPASPAWSFRSRAGSSISHDGGSFFSRFGTRRSTKTVPGISVGAHDQ